MRLWVALSVVAATLFMSPGTSFREATSVHPPDTCVGEGSISIMDSGHVDGVAEDVKLLPRGKNFLGSFALVSHSGPKGYLQRVPLDLFAPRLTPLQVDRGVTVADVYPTVGSLLGPTLDSGEGELLNEALNGSASPVPLVVVVVWDGAGTNVLGRWPEAWPNLVGLREEGVSYSNATVGSSPSITPAIHSTLGTGVFPIEHGVTGIQYRVDEDTIGVAFEGRDTSILQRTTFGDEIDQAYDNESKVGLLGWRSWQMGMLGHGSSIIHGDRDDLAIIDQRGRVTGKRPYFKVPPYLRGEESGLLGHLEDADASDGELDGEWMGHPIDADQENPGWVSYQSELLRKMILEGGYGADEVPDILLTNFKATDRVGHLYNMESPEMEQILRAQDAALGELVDLLDKEVEDYVLILTADHGHTPSPEVTGAWPINQRELESDLDDYFSVPSGETITQAMTAVGLFVDRPLMEKIDVAEDAIAEFLLGYTIGENWTGDVLPEGYEERADETVFEAAFSAKRLPEMMECARSREASG